MLPLIALVLPSLLLFCGLVIDVTTFENTQAGDQLAADAAAGSAALEYQTGVGDFVASGKQTAGLYGLTDGSNGVTVTVKQQPTSGAFAGRNDAIQVTVAQPSPTYFMRFWQSEPMHARAVALIPPCVFLRGSQSMYVSSSTLQTGCPVYANGTVWVSGTSWTSTGVLLTSGGSLNGSVPTSVATGTPNRGDPLAAVAQPTASGCLATGFSQNGGSVVLQPGTYCQGMSLSNATVTLSPGLYVVTGGAHWSGVTLQGTGVTLFFTNGSSGYGQFVIDNNSTVNLSAPVDGSASGVPGVVVFGDRAWQAQSVVDFQINGSQVQTNGIWYTTGTGVWVNQSTLSGPTYLGMDVSGLALTSSTLQGGADFSSLTTGNPFQQLGGLAE